MQSVAIAVERDLDILGLQALDEFGEILAFDPDRDRLRRYLREILRRLGEVVIDHL